MTQKKDSRGETKADIEEVYLNEYETFEDAFRNI
jgi:hypothetical protein